MYKKISKKEALEILANNEALLFDIRDEASYNNGHVDNAIHIQMADLPKIINNVDKSTPLLLMCYHGNSSQTVADYLGKNGFQEVYSIVGGYEGWIIE